MFAKYLRNTFILNIFVYATSTLQGSNLCTSKQIIGIKYI